MDDGSSRSLLRDTGASGGDLLGALLSDGRLLERISQIVAKTRAAGSSATNSDDVQAEPPLVGSSPLNVTPSTAPSPGATAAVPDLDLLAALLGGASATPMPNADDGPTVPVSSAPSATSATSDAHETQAEHHTSQAGAASAAHSNAPTDRLSGLTSLLTDDDFMAKLPGLLSMLSSVGGGRDGGKGNADGKSGAHGGTQSIGRGGGERCIALLAALKPYMNPRRCEAIDYLIRMNRMGDIIRRIR